MQCYRSNLVNRLNRNYIFLEIVEQGHLESKDLNNLMTQDAKQKPKWWQLFKSPKSNIKAIGNLVKNWHFDYALIIIFDDKNHKIEPYLYCYLNYDGKILEELRALNKEYHFNSSDSEKVRQFTTLVKQIHQQYSDFRITNTTIYYSDFRDKTGNIDFKVVLVGYQNPNWDNPTIQLVFWPKGQKHLAVRKGLCSRKTLESLIDCSLIWTDMQRVLKVPFLKAIIESVYDNYCNYYSNYIATTEAQKTKEAKTQELLQAKMEQDYRSKSQQLKEHYGKAYVNKWETILFGKAERAIKYKLEDENIKTTRTKYIYQQDDKNFIATFGICQIYDSNGVAIIRPFAKLKLKNQCNLGGQVAIDEDIFVLFPTLSVTTSNANEDFGLFNVKEFELKFANKLRFKIAPYARDEAIFDLYQKLLPGAIKVAKLRLGNKTSGAPFKITWYY